MQNLHRGLRKIERRNFDARKKSEQQERVMNGMDPLEGEEARALRLLKQKDSIIRLSESPQKVTRVNLEPQKQMSFRSKAFQKRVSVIAEPAPEDDTSTDDILSPDEPDFASVVFNRERPFVASSAELAEVLELVNNHY